MHSSFGGGGGGGFLGGVEVRLRQLKKTAPIVLAEKQPFILHNFGSGLGKIMIPAPSLFFAGSCMEIQGIIGDFRAT